MTFVRTLQACAWLTFIAGLAAIFFGFRFGPASWPTAEEVPLCKPSGIVVDRENQIHCALPYAHRVQIYDPDGNFLRSYLLDTGGGSIGISLAENGRIEIEVYRKRHILVYDSLGTLLETRSRTPQAFDGVRSRADRLHAAGGGFEYKIDGEWLLPVLTKQAHGEPPKVIVPQRIPIWTFLFPIGFSASFVGIVAVVLLHYLRRFAQRQIVGIPKALAVD